MRRLFAIAALGLLTLTLPVLASVPGADDATITPNNGGVGTRVDCPGTIVWDTGMFDEFTPPVGCSTAASSQCFVEGLNDGGFPSDGRRLADDFFGTGGDPITHVKFWARYNQQGYDYHAQNPGSLHGFCVKFYRTDPLACPDGTVPGEEAIGTIVYDEYVQDFVEEEIFTGMVRNFNYCVTLPVPFETEPDIQYWFSVSADFDFTTYVDGVTQWFWRVYPGLAISACEAAWWDTWNTPNVNWGPVSVGANIPCWEGWDASMVLYSNPAQPQNGACCLADGSCVFVTRDECNAQGGVYQGDNVPCDQVQCQPTPTEQKTWGSIKANFR